MKYRLIETPDELTVVTEDGGIVCIREAEPITDGEPRIATTDYYESRITDLDLSALSDEVDIWALLAEGKMYWNDWVEDTYNSEIVINDALAWLTSDTVDFERDDTLFSHLDLT